MRLRSLFCTLLVSLPALGQVIGTPSATQDSEVAEVPQVPAALAKDRVAPQSSTGNQSTQARDTDQVPMYVSPSGLFSMPIPVRQELGGEIRDDVLFVHFFDSFTTHITVGVVEMDATFRWERSVMSRQEFLTSVFQKIVSPQFASRCPDTKVDSVMLLPKLLDGTLYVGSTHPGFSQFIQRTVLFGAGDNIPVGRIGTMVFTKGDFIFIVSSELGERATERSRHTMSDAEENKILMSRLRSLVSKITVTLPATEEVKP